MTHTLHHGGERIAEALLAHGVSHLFTLCGGHISPILAAAKARGLRVVDVRDEATAVFAADASARLTGRPGVAAVTAGPGITNTLTALKNAQLAQSPLLLLGGAAPTALQGRGALQDIDQQPLVAPHVKRFYKLRRVADLAPAVVEAFALAQAGVPGPVFIECPVDLLYDAATVRQWYADAAGKGTAVADRALRWVLQRHTERMFAGSAAPYLPKPQAPPAPRATDSSIQAALAALRHSQRPLLVIGSQAVVRAAQVHTLAAAVQRLGIPVYLSGMARGLLGRGRALQMRHQRRHALREADCVLLAGVPCDFRLDYGRHVRRGATLIAANRSNRDAQLNRRPDILALGDAGDFITALADALTAPNSGWAGWCDTLRERDRQREAEIDAQAGVAGEHVNPLALLRALEAEAVVTLVEATNDGAPAAEGEIPIQYEGLAQDLHAADVILLDDGRVVLTVTEVTGQLVRATVTQAGTIRDRVGVHLPARRVRISTLTEKDKTDLSFGLSLGVDYVALSFVRSADDVRHVREITEAWGRPTPIVSKIETPSAIDHLESIILASDAVMVTVAGGPSLVAMSPVSGSMSNPVATAVK